MKTDTTTSKLPSSPSSAPTPPLSVRDSNWAQGQVIAVTGSSRGIGAAIARRLAHEGAHVIVTYQSQPEKAQKLLAELPGTNHLCLPLEVADETSVEKFFSQIMEKYGRLNALVNNAGITRDNLILRMKNEDFDSVLRVNLRGAFLCSRAAIKIMLKCKIEGAVVNLTSVVGQTGQAGQANYAASKAGIEAMTKSLASELGSRRIRFNCVAPGFIVTDMTDALTDAQKTEIANKIPLQSLGHVDDIAAAVAFLLSPDARYITGQTLSVNGGMNMA